MPVNKSNSNVVNAVEAGFKPGQAAATKNKAILSSLLGMNKNVYIPTGEWWLDGVISRSNSNGKVKIYGDGASLTRILQLQDLSRTLVIQDYKAIEIEDLAFIGQIGRNGPQGLDVNDTDLTSYNTPLWLVGCENVRIRNCEFSGWSTKTGALVYQDCRVVNIQDNLFWNNEELNSLGCDILQRASNDTYGSRIPGTDHVITGNQCLSNNNVGIGLIQPANRFIISNNICVAKDENLEEVLDMASGLRRKEGISVYNITSVNQRVTDSHRGIITDNQVKNTRWSGIYLNANNIGNVQDNRGGFNGTVSGNRVDNTCNEVGPGQSANLQGGIAVIATQGCVIANNVITRVRGYGQFDPDTGSAWNAGIILSSELGGTPNTDGIKMQTSIICEGNHVSDIMGFGIWVDTPTSPVTISGNHVVDASLGAFEVNGECDQDLTIINNLFWQSSNGREPVLRGATARANSDPSTVLFSYFVDSSSGTGKATFRGNTIRWDYDLNQSSSFQDNDQLYLLQVDGDGGKDTIIDNEIVSSAPKVATHRISGIRLKKLPTTREFANRIRLESNTVQGCYYGVLSDAEGTSKGPVILDSFRWIDNAADIATSSNDAVFNGRWLGDICEVRSTATNPTSGNWIEGDTYRTALSLFVCDGDGEGVNASWAQAWTGA